MLKRNGWNWKSAKEDFLAGKISADEFEQKRNELKDIHEQAAQEKRQNQMKRELKRRA